MLKKDAIPNLFGHSKPRKTRKLPATRGRDLETNAMIQTACVRSDHSYAKKEVTDLTPILLLARLSSYAYFKVNPGQQQQCQSSIRIPFCHLFVMNTEDVDSESMVEIASCQSHCQEAHQDVARLKKEVSDLRSRLEVMEKTCEDYKKELKVCMSFLCLITDQGKIIQQNKYHGLLFYSSVGTSRTVKQVSPKWRTF